MLPVMNYVAIVPRTEGDFLLKFAGARFTVVELSDIINQTVIYAQSNF